MSKIERTLDALHSWIVSKRLLQVFTAFTRLILFVGFLPPSMIKIVNRPFTVLPDSHPVGHYFNALYQTGFYYQFIGWAQLIAAVLLLFPRTAHLGALLFLPIIANIAVLTASVGFQGTWLVTLFMALAAAYLVAWDYDRLKPIVFGRRTSQSAFVPTEFWFLPVVFAIGGVGAGLFAAAIGLGNFSDYGRVTAALAAAGAIFGLGVSVHHRFMKAGNLESAATANEVRQIV